jgi:hypothetical protein
MAGVYVNNVAMTPIRVLFTHATELACLPHIVKHEMDHLFRCIAYRAIFPAAYEYIAQLPLPCLCAV